MGRYIIRRLIAFAATLLVVITLTFFLMHAIPGGPWDTMQATPEGKIISPEAIEQLNRLYGLDKPVWRQYLIYLRNLTRFDFGFSYYNKTRTVLQLFLELWPYTVHVGLMTIGFAALVGVSLGIVAAIKQNTWVDNVATLAALFAFVVPSFVFAVLMQYIFAVKLGWFPTAGWEGPKYWVLPVVAGGMLPLGTLQRYTRSGMVDVMRANYVRTARAKGMRERTVMMVHVFKNALTPLVTVGGRLVAGLLTGGLWVESMFGIPGLGYYTLQAIGKRDYPMIMANTIVYGTAITLAYLLTDVAYALIDPRVSYFEGK